MHLSFNKCQRRTKIGPRRRGKKGPLSVLFRVVPVVHSVADTDRYGSRNLLSSVSTAACSDAKPLLIFQQFARGYSPHSDDVYPLSAFVAATLFGPKELCSITRYLLPASKSRRGGPRKLFRRALYVRIDTPITHNSRHPVLLRNPSNGANHITARADYECSMLGVKQK